jgi:DNA repair photolyase
MFRPDNHVTDNNCTCEENKHAGISFRNISQKPACYDLENFNLLNIDRKLLTDISSACPISDEITAEMLHGTEWFRQLFDNRSLTPAAWYEEKLTDSQAELEIHNYTGICPTNVLEVTPSSGSCSVACQYCLVTDGSHLKPITVYTNYTERLANSLERNRDKAIFYYFSPKTEAFSEPHLFNGIAHEVIRTFIDHFDRHPDSHVRIFIATKAGPQHLNIEHRGDSLFSLMGAIASRIQVNGSIGIMPDYLRNVLEPNAASIEERLEALVKCRALGMHAESVLCQPLILPYLTDGNLESYFSMLSQAGVHNIKPEFLTTEIRNLVILAQYINHYDPGLIGEFFEPYLAEGNHNHIKQRSRIAPDRKVSVMHLERLKHCAEQYGLTISICNWVKRELGSVADWVKSIDLGSNANGYRCLGYQTNMFHA